MLQLNNDLFSGLPQIYDCKAINIVINVMVTTFSKLHHGLIKVLFFKKRKKQQQTNQVYRWMLKRENNNPIVFCNILGNTVF